MEFGFYVGWQGSEYTVVCFVEMQEIFDLIWFDIIIRDAGRFLMQEHLIEYAHC